MRRAIIFLTFVIFLSSLVSSEIIINQQPQQLYNLGDVVNVPVIISPLTEVSGVLTMDLICGGKTAKFYQNGIFLAAGEEKRLDSSLVLNKLMIGNMLGNCKIKIKLNEEYILTNQFKISNTMSVVKTSSQSEFNPGESLFLQGDVLKENGNGANGFINVTLITENSSINYVDIINEGTFSVNFSLQKDMKAGAYLVKLFAYETDLDGTLTNNGFSDFNIIVKQVPTNLEIIFENQEIEPGTIMKVKAILHDQTGESMPSKVYLTVKNEDDKILEQLEKNTDEFLEFPTLYNEPPVTWKIVAASNKIMSESFFKIKAKEKVKVEIINKTIIITNIGNVPYNNSVLVKVGIKSVPIDVFLDVDESKKFIMTAPDGGYNIEVKTSEGDLVTGMVSLTGKQINVTEASGQLIDFIRNPAVWIFIILILGLFILMLFRKIRKKSFFGFMKARRREPKKERHMELSSEGIVNPNTSNKAELSLSIKGEKQNVSMACLKIRNLSEVSRERDVRDTLYKINEIAEDNKAVLYENQDCLFYILVPMRTKTFQNESAGLHMAQEMANILSNHNRMFKHKIDFGISLNYGEMVTKQEDTLKIMSLGTLMSSAKKIASLAKRELLLGEKMNEKVMRFAKTQREDRNGIKVYSVKGIKDTDKHKKFLDSFTKRYEEENM